MSANGSDDDEIPGREIAYRLFAAEYDDAEFSYAESDEERAPNYVVSPTGARLNRMFAVGTLTEITSVNDEMLRARIVDPTGAFVVYAGQYQPEALAVLEQLAPPAFIAVSGKARTFEPEDGDRVYTSIRPESIAEVDAATRDRWVVSTAEQTLDRIGTYAEAATVDAHGDALTDALQEAGVESGLAAGIPLAQDHYGTTPGYLAALRDCATEAVEVVADERDEVSGFAARPGEMGSDDTTFDALASFAAVGDQDLDLEAHAPTAAAETGAPDEAGEQDAEPEPIAATADAGDETAAAAGTATTSEPETAAVEFDESEGDSSTSPADAEDESGTAVEAETESEPVAETESELDDGSESESEPESGSESEPEPEVETEAAADSDDALGDFDGGDSGMYEMDEEEREQIEDEFGTEFTTGAEVDDPGEADIDVPSESDADDASDESEPASDESPTGEASTDADDELGEPPASTVGDDAGADEEAADTGEDAADPDANDETDETVEPDETADAESDADQTESDSDDAADEQADDPAEDVDLQEYVVDTMQELDDGSGADRTELVDTVAADTGASAEDVEDAIQDALMGGQCYEPDDETLKAI
ncbi:hypothetical protein [Natrialba sp. SSL1]|uniref:hypothetical protein n=1 Tax=Natrialba sp. SSL1 TaxID=1869245 RepID=UPI0008F85188|nr:hypothetical protein [Natrialba sp. SSL1]OIB57126.1 hypothetical protein BBD46_15430 [Natrialba sp. SSL1]